MQIRNLPQPYRAQAEHRMDKNAISKSVMYGWAWDAKEWSYWNAIARHSPLPEYEIFCEEDELILKLFNLNSLSD